MAMPWWPCKNLEGLVRQSGGAELGQVWFLGHLLPSLHQPFNTGSFAVLLPASDSAPNLRGDKAGFGQTLLNWQQRKKFTSINLMQWKPVKLLLAVCLVLRLVLGDEATQAVSPCPACPPCRGAAEHSCSSSHSPQTMHALWAKELGFPTAELTRMDAVMHPSP